MNVLLGLAVLMYISPRLNDISMEIDGRLKDLQPKYDWSATFAEKPLGGDIDDKLDATRKWDAIQWTYQCCGVESPADWIPYRPKDSAGEFPASCCFSLDEEKSCFQENSWTSGCVTQIKSANGKLSLLLTSLIFMNLLVSIVGNLVIFCQPKQGYLVF